MEVSKFKSFVSEQLLCREVCALKLSLKAPVIISSGILPLEEHNGPCLCSFASDPPYYCLLLSREICFLFPFLFDAQLTKCPYLNKKKGVSALLGETKITLSYSECHSTIESQSSWTGKGKKAYANGRDFFSSGQMLLASSLIILVARAKFKWSIKCTH